MTMPILLNGARGRMGQAIAAVAEEEGCRIVAECDIGSNPVEHLPNCGVVVDFSSHESTPDLAEECAAQGKPLVIGTTGHTPEETERIKACAEKIPMVWAGNYSIGVNLLIHLTRQAAKLLPESYHPEIVEMHHRHKKDAPSGTAENLLEAVLEGRQWEPEAALRSRSGLTGERPDQEVGVHALRGGSVVGEHTVVFAGPSERIEFSHSAGDRSIFARGALTAAKWVAGKKPGIYRMGEVLGLTDGTED
ncbi:4-hydroxy-tetrahydrodipicolinate reductase [Puniceicoccus vermicola]|uniref:4-hydroxy-tetrahydrodipicolinate reductase n=2 Tax=Puniceicoccus vermicola TaxID=388746 RepID=A0A7X1AYE1_9BACT|nr:4-hydroxy-tetrahydrodipicolinate reductase [Puniceicoccus vermicola]MBC2602247.1 4-hydroxy-tetrahydrodipicolinate reductase [Puniceicoccus vermicola]